MLTDTVHPLDSVNRYKWKKGAAWFYGLPQPDQFTYMLAAYSDWYNQILITYIYGHITSGAYDGTLIKRPSNYVFDSK